MQIRFTEQQSRQLVDGEDRERVVAIDPQTARRYVLLLEEEYERWEDDREQALLRRASLRRLGDRLRDDR